MVNSGTNNWNNRRFGFSEDAVAPSIPLMEGKSKEMETKGVKQFV